MKHHDAPLERRLRSAYLQQKTPRPDAAWYEHTLRRLRAQPVTPAPAVDAFLWRAAFGAAALTIVLLTGTARWTWSPGQLYWQAEQSGVTAEWAMASGD